MNSKPAEYSAEIIERRWLSQGTFELTLNRPAGFTFAAGQKIRIGGAEPAREYSLISAPADPFLKMCIRRIEGGNTSEKLSVMSVGAELSVQGPYGYFTFRPSGRQAVFVATGTGIAPFVSMTRAGENSFILLHGVRQLEELYYQSELEKAAHRYLPFISEPSQLPGGYHAGRVTDYLAKELSHTAHDFYLCGRGEMIRDAILLIDERFEGSHVFSEKFY